MKLWLVLIALLVLFATIARCEEEADVSPEAEATKEVDVGDTDGFTQAELDLLKGDGEQHDFQAEVNKLMGIIINSLYSNREVFLREVISNAVDALSKIRYMKLVDKESAGPLDLPLRVNITFDTKLKTLEIQDTGIGMTADELVENLGSIAKSGTLEFFQRLENEESADDEMLIGQFGLGFYSVFLVADYVTVVSKSPKDGKQNMWVSDAKGKYSIKEDDEFEDLERGTLIRLHLKEDAKEFANVNKLRDLVQKYSQFTDFPIYLLSSHYEHHPVEEEPSEDAKKEKEDGESSDGETSDEESDMELEDSDDEKEPEKPKTVQVTVWEWELLNDQRPLWTRNPADVSEEEYRTFYAAISKDEDHPPLDTIHFAAEGEVNFQSVLFIPSKQRVDMPVGAGPLKNIKLYVNKVFVSDDFTDMMPSYLGFVVGVIASDDLPLNVNREILQQNRATNLIQRKVVRKVLDRLRAMREKDREKYDQFYEEFSFNLKLGVRDDPMNRMRVARILQFYSADTPTVKISLDEYIADMAEGQKEIYYIADKSVEAAQQSPLIEGLRSKGYNVLYLVDVVDESGLQHLPEYGGKKLQNVGREGAFEGDEDDAKAIRRAKKEFDPFLKWVKSILGDEISKAVVSNRMKDSPCILVAGKFDLSANMQRILKEQAYAHKDFIPPPLTKPTFELNPFNKVVRSLKYTYETGDLELAEENLRVLHDLARLTSGFSIESVSEFGSRVINMLGNNLPSEDENVERDEL